MKYLFLSLVALLLAACAAPGSGPGTAEPPSNATAAWRAAYDTRDPGRIVAMYAPDAMLWGTTAKKIAPNPDAVAEYFKDAAKRPDARVNFGEQHWRMYGDIAVSSGYYTFSDVRDGKPIARPARYTMVFRNMGGAWKIVAHHSSEMP